MATQTDRPHEHRPQTQEKPTPNDAMPLVIPYLSWTGLDYVLAPETQNLIINYAVTSAVEHPWTTSFLAILALFAILPVLGLVIALIVLAGFVLFWLGVVSLPSRWKDNTMTVFVFAAAMAVAGMFAVGAWLYCVALVVSTRWLLGLFSSVDTANEMVETATSTTTAEAGKPAVVKKEKEATPTPQQHQQRKEIKQEPVEEDWDEEKEESDDDDDNKTLHGLSTDDDSEAPRKVGEVSERDRMRRDIQKSLR